jgi:hypothetical protein
MLLSLPGGSLAFNKLYIVFMSSSKCPYLYASFFPALGVQSGIAEALLVFISNNSTKPYK